MGRRYRCQGSRRRFDEGGHVMEQFRRMSLLCSYILTIEKKGFSLIIYSVTHRSGVTLRAWGRLLTEGETRGFVVAR